MTFENWMQAGFLAWIVMAFVAFIFLVYLQYVAWRNGDQLSNLHRFSLLGLVIVLLFCFWLMHVPDADAQERRTGIISPGPTGAVGVTTLSQEELSNWAIAGYAVRSGGVLKATTEMNSEAGGNLTYIDAPIPVSLNFSTKFGFADTVLAGTGHIDPIPFSGAGGVARTIFGVTYVNSLPSINGEVEILAWRGVMAPAVSFNATAGQAIPSGSTYLTKTLETEFALDPSLKIQATGIDGVSVTIHNTTASFTANHFDFVVWRPDMQTYQSVFPVRQPFAVDGEGKMIRSFLVWEGSTKTLTSYYELSMFETALWFDASVDLTGATYLADTWNEGNSSSTNRESNTLLRVGSISGNARALLEIDIDSAAGGPIEDVSAIVWLNKSGSGGSTTVHLGYSSKDEDMTTSTYGNMGTISQIATSVFDQSISNGWYALSHSVINTWLADSSQGNAFDDLILYSSTEGAGGTNYIDFSSLEGGAAWYVEIEYTPLNQGIKSLNRIVSHADLIGETPSFRLNALINAATALANIPSSSYAVFRSGFGEVTTALTSNQFVVKEATGFNASQPYAFVVDVSGTAGDQVYSVAAEVLGATVYVADRYKVSGGGGGGGTSSDEVLRTAVARFEVDMDRLRDLNADRPHWGDSFTIHTSQIRDNRLQITGRATHPSNIQTQQIAALLHQDRVSPPIASEVAGLNYGDPVGITLATEAKTVHGASVEHWFMGMVWEATREAGPYTLVVITKATPEADLPNSTLSTFKIIHDATIEVDSSGLATSQDITDLETRLRALGVRDGQQARTLTARQNREPTYISSASAAASIDDLRWVSGQVIADEVTQTDVIDGTVTTAVFYYDYNPSGTRGSGKTAEQSNLEAFAAAAGIVVPGSADINSVTQ